MACISKKSLSNSLTYVSPSLKASQTPLISCPVFIKRPKLCAIDENDAFICSPTLLTPLILNFKLLVLSVALLIGCEISIALPLDLTWFITLSNLSNEFTASLYSSVSTKSNFSAFDIWAFNFCIADSKLLTWLSAILASLNCATKFLKESELLSVVPLKSSIPFCNLFIADESNIFVLLIKFNLVCIPFRAFSTCL